MVKFRVLKYKHYRTAQELNKRIESGDATDDDVLAYAVSLVEEWDFVDVETGEPLPLGEMDELSRDQLKEVITLFSEEFGILGEVPKVSA